MGQTSITDLLGLSLYIRQPLDNSEGELDDRWKGLLYICRRDDSSIVAKLSAESIYDHNGNHFDTSAI